MDRRSDDPAADRLKGADFARRALDAAGDDPGILATAALALGYFGEDTGAMGYSLGVTRHFWLRNICPRRRKVRPSDGGVDYRVCHVTAAMENSDTGLRARHNTAIDRILIAINGFRDLQRPRASHCTPPNQTRKASLLCVSPAKTQILSMRFSVRTGLDRVRSRHAGCFLNSAPARAFP
jgi:hypothetical protein